MEQVPPDAPAPDSPVSQAPGPRRGGGRRAVVRAAVVATSLVCATAGGLFLYMRKRTSLGGLAAEGVQSRVLDVSLYTQRGVYRGDSRMRAWRSALDRRRALCGGFGSGGDFSLSAADALVKAQEKADALKAEAQVASSGRTLGPSPSPTASTAPNTGFSVAKLLGEDQKEKELCARTLTYNLLRHPVALSVAVQDGDALVAYLEKNETFASLTRTPVMQGILFPFVDLLSLRGQDFSFPGGALGAGLAEAFVAPMAKAFATADAVIHYSPFHGRKGIVLSYDAGKAGAAQKTLALLVRQLARTGYEIPGAPARLWEFRLGTQTLYATEWDGRGYVAIGLSALLNVLDDASLAEPMHLKGTVVARARMEAYFETLLASLAGQERFHAEFSFVLDAASAAPLAARVDKARLFEGLSGRISKDVLSAFPKDVFFAAAANLSVPRDLRPEALLKRIAAGQRLLPLPGSESTRDGASENAAGGIGFVWDLETEPEPELDPSVWEPGQARADSDANLTQVGLVFKDVWDDESAARAQLEPLFASTETLRRCARGDAWIYATSPRLATRMHEACEGDASSLLDLQVAGVGLDAQSAVVALDPGGAAWELYRAGQGPEDAPSTKLEAARVMARETRSTLARIPMFGFAGQGQADGYLALNGFVASKGTRP